MKEAADVANFALFVWWDMHQRATPEGRGREAPDGAEEVAPTQE